jgi:replicative DNA helicase
MVCFIHRPEYYRIYTSSDGTDLRGIAEIIIAKHRNGAIGDVRLRFRGEYTRFQNLEDDLLSGTSVDGKGTTYGSKINAPRKQTASTGARETLPPPLDVLFDQSTDHVPF